MAAKKRKDAKDRDRQKSGKTIDPQAVVVGSTVTLMRWRLQEAATRIGDAADATARGDYDRAVEHLLEIEPLVFESQRLLSAVFLMTKEIKKCAKNCGD